MIFSLCKIDWVYRQCNFVTKCLLFKNNVSFLCWQRKKLQDTRITGMSTFFGRSSKTNTKLLYLLNVILVWLQHNNNPLCIPISKKRKDIFIKTYRNIVISCASLIIIIISDSFLKNVWHFFDGPRNGIILWLIVYVINNNEINKIHNKYMYVYIYLMKVFYDTLI